MAATTVPITETLVTTFSSDSEDVTVHIQVYTCISMAMRVMFTCTHSVIAGLYTYWFVVFILIGPGFLSSLSLRLYYVACYTHVFSCTRLCMVSEAVEPVASACVTVPLQTSQTCTILHVYEYMYALTPSHSLSCTFV